jgi:hypothetical protein
MSTTDLALEHLLEISSLILSKTLGRSLFRKDLMDGTLQTVASRRFRYGLLRETKAMELEMKNLIISSSVSEIRLSSLHPVSFM